MSDASDKKLLSLVVKELEGEPIRNLGPPPLPCHGHPPFQRPLSRLETPVFACQGA